ncbi:MAG: hypothetical protein RLZZ618_2768 [Pseudomonadota bacterium]|jgi:hypothetical protein
MNRRTFSLTASALAAAPLAACGDKKRADPPPLPPVPEFSAERLHTGLEALRLAYEAKGFNVSETLQPGLSDDEFNNRCSSWLAAPLPKEMLALYAWRGGQQISKAPKDFPFSFRDCAFSTPDEAKAEYIRMMSTYGANPGDSELLRNCFPFAAFNGGWLVMPCGNQSLEPRLQRPIISVMQGVAVHYHSIERMVATVTDCVSHPKHDGHGLPSDIELDLWRRHNPGIFQR